MADGLIDTIVDMQKRQVLISSLYIKDASNLLQDQEFEYPCIGTISSETLNGTYQRCHNMKECRINSIYLPVSMVLTFYTCGSLETIKTGGSISTNSDCLDLSKCVTASMAFDGCHSLTHIDKITNIKVSLDFADCPLDDETVDMLLSNLIASDTSKKLTLKSDIVKKLTNEQLAKVPSGWVLG